MSEAFFVNLDLTETEQWNGVSTAVAPGTYVFEVAEAEQTMSSSNEPQIHVILKVVETVASDVEEDQVGRQQHKWYSLKQDKWVLARLKNFLVAVGAPLGGFGKDDLVGRQFQGTVTQRTLPGRPMANGQMGEPKVVSDIVGETALAGATPAATAAPAAAGRRVVGQATRGNGAPAPRQAR